MSNIPKEEISFDPTSYVDPGSRVFKWRGEIYRAIAPERAQLYRDLLQKDWFLQLQEEGLLVRTEITDFTLENYPLVLKHQKIPFLTYCIGWPGVMLKEAALLTLDINLRIAQHGLTLQDAYPWNIYFEGTKPILVDFTSIVPADANYLWAAYDQFCRFFLFPLYLHSLQKSRVARLLLMRYFYGVEHEDLLNLLSFWQKILRPNIFSRITLPFYIDRLFNKLSLERQTKFKDQMKQVQVKFNDSKMRIKFLTKLRKEVNAIPISAGQTHWLDYYKNRTRSLKEKDFSKGLELKDKAISDILDRVQPKTVLDIGANVGRYSVLAAEKGAKVVSWERDRSCVFKLYKEAQKRELYIIPLVIDLINPLPSFGWCGKQFPSAMERSKCEMVFCLALIHHLVFQQWQNFERITEALDMLSLKWVIVEFVPREDEYIRSRWEEKFEWYNLDNLIQCLKTRFSKIEAFDSYPKGRKLLLCEK